MEVASRIALAATPSIRGNPTAECADGNAHVVSPRNNVKNLKVRFRSTARIKKNTMKSVKRTIVRVVTYNKRKRTATLRPKGTESDYNGYSDVIVDGRTILGLQMASKVFIIICDVELGKPPKLPEYPGRDPVRANDNLWGRGFGKKANDIL